MHGYRTIADIMRSYNPFTGETYKEALHMSRIGREMICLMEGRHVHPSTIYPGGVGTVATPTLFTDYLSRLLRTLDFIKKAVAMNDDVFDFFYEALPGYEEVGRRRILLGCWGAFNNPAHVDYDYKNMDDWGNEMFVTPGVVVDGELVTTNLVDINLGIRILLGSSYYEDWENEETFVDKDPLGNPVDKRHPWNQTTIPKPQKRDLDGGNYSWVMSPRWYDKRTGDYLALDTGGGALARLWATALANKVHTPYVNATGDERDDQPAEDDRTRRSRRSSGRSRKWSNAIERDRARIYFVAYAAGMALHFLDQAFNEVKSGNTKVFEDFDVPDEAIGVRLPRGGAGRALAPPGDPRREDRQLPPLPADAVERQPDRLLRDTRPLRGRGDGPADLRGEQARRTSGASTSCARCAASTRACRAECTCTWATARCSSRCTRRCSAASTTAERAAAMDDQEARERVGRVEALLEEIESLPDPAAQATLHRAGRRAARPVRGRACAHRGAAAPSPQALGDDELVSHLLLLHGLHPVPVEARVRGALEEVRPYLESHGGNVELVSRRRTGVAPAADGGQLQRLPILGGDAEAGDRGGDPQGRSGGRVRSRPRTHQPGRQRRRPALIELAPLAPRENGGRAWATAGVLPQLRAGGTVLKEVAGEPVLFLRGGRHALRVPPDLPGLRRVAGGGGAAGR